MYLYEHVKNYQCRILTLQK